MRDECDSGQVFGRLDGHPSVLATGHPGIGWISRVVLIGVVVKSLLVSPLRL
jgi:hypothetical protein